MERKRKNYTKSKKKKVGKKEKDPNAINGKTMGPISTKARYEEKFYESFLE